jgi:hypothetical protein
MAPSKSGPLHWKKYQLAELKLKLCFLAVATQMAVTPQPNVNLFILTKASLRICVGVVSAIKAAKKMTVLSVKMLVSFKSTIVPSATYSHCSKDNL